MTSVERIKQFGNLKQEAAEHNEHPIPLNWPTGGAIVFDHVTLKYMPEYSPSLTDICFIIKSNEKVHNT